MFLLFRVFALIQDAAYLKDEKLVFVINTLTLSLKKTNTNIRFATDRIVKLS